MRAHPYLSVKEQCPQRTCLLQIFYEQHELQGIKCRSLGYSWCNDVNICIIFRSTLLEVTDNQKRWLVFGIALHKVLVTQICPFVEQEVQKEYGKLQTSHRIHTQSVSAPLEKWHRPLRYENINGNDALPRLPDGNYDYSSFKYQVSSHVDFAKLYVENHMAKFDAFDERCSASVVLVLLGNVPIFPYDVQSAAGAVRKARNAWGHCEFSDWSLENYKRRFSDMIKLVKALHLLPAIERNLLSELRDWETKGTCLVSIITFFFNTALSQKYFMKGSRHKDFH